MESDQDVPYPIAWKRAYLALSDTINAFQQQWLHWEMTFTPPPGEPWQGNVARLLAYHLNRSRELLWAEVNGGLDEEYQREIDALALAERDPEEVDVASSQTDGTSAPTQP